MLENRETTYVDKEFLLWFVGFFDGDGSVGKVRLKGRDRETYFLSLAQSVKNNGEAVTREIQRHLGGGIYYHEPKAKASSPNWCWRLGRRFQIRDLLNLMIPHLRVKKRQAIKIRDEINTLPYKGTAWGTDEKIKIKELLDGGKSYMEIENATGRSREAIGRKVRKLWPELARPKWEGVGRRKVVQMDLDGNDVRVWDSMTAAMRGLGFSGNISSVCSGIQKTAGGHRWRYY